MGQPVPVDDPQPEPVEVEGDKLIDPKKADCPVCKGTGLWSGIEGTLYRCLACCYEMT